MSNGIDSLPPKTAFFAGLIGGILIVLALGFFILLGTMVTGGSLNLKGGGAARAGGAQAANTAPSPSPSPSPSPARAADPPSVTDQDHVRGNPNAQITMIEYSDYECPFCKRFHPTTLQVLEKYPNDVRLIYRHFPLSFHANAKKEAEAGECVAELGGNDAFWKYTDAIFERTTANGTGFALTALGPLAKELGLDQAKFQECLDSGKYAQFVQDQMDAGAAAGVSGTPGTFIVNADGEAQLIPGALPFESIDQVIQSML